jgi:hypothetical protein
VITTTLNRIQKHSPCPVNWRMLLASLGKTTADDEPLPYSRIVEINGLEYALWCCRAEPQHTHEWGLFAVWCARQVQHLMTDPRSIADQDVTVRRIDRGATDEEVISAWAPAWRAEHATRAAQTTEFLRIVNLYPALARD